jgi:ferredoxin
MSQDSKALRWCPALGPSLERMNEQCTESATAASGTAQGKSLRVRIDRDRCQGHHRCKALAPELFELDSLGKAHPVGDGRVAPELEEKAWLARANCPEAALDVTEE